MLRQIQRAFAAMTDDPPPLMWGEGELRTLTFTDFADDAWSVLRLKLPPDADVPLLLAAREAAHDVLSEIMQAERRPSLHPDTAWLLESARMSVIGRIAMIDNWRGNLGGTASYPRPYGEDTDYANAMRMRPEMLARVVTVTRRPRDTPDQPLHYSRMMKRITPS
jgi:hypothetical protein